MTWGGVAEVERSGSTRLERWSGPAGTTLRVRTAPTSTAFKWVVVGAYTDRAELKEVVSVENRDITVAALAYYHDPDEIVLILDAPVMNARWYGPVGTVVTAGMLAAANAQYTAVYGALTPVIADWMPALLGTENVFTVSQFIGTDDLKSSLPGLTIARVLTDTLNARAFHDASIFSGDTDRSYASYDAMAETGGVNNLNHIIGFQARNEHAGAGTLGIYYGFGSWPNITGGNVTALFGFYAEDPIGAGTITTNYGLYIAAMTRGSANYAIYTNAGAVSFGGTVTIRSGGLTTDAGGIALTSPSTPIQATRSLSITTGVATLATLLAKTSDDMADGFGPVIALNIQDDTSASATLAQIGAVRAGADNTGDLIVTTATGGTATEKLRVTSGGDVRVIVGKLVPVLKAAASAPAYEKGALYFNTTSNKLMVGGAAGWETVTSS